VTRLLAAIVFLALLLVPAPLATAAGTNGRIVFASARDGNEEIYSANPDGSDPRDLSQNPAADTQPAVSPDGTHIAFVSDRDAGRDLYVMGADGSTATRITDGYYLSVDAEPAWSPDGSQLAFASTRPFNDGWHIWLANADGSNLRQLTSGFGVSPSWSPDGTRIAYDGGGAIWLVDVDGTNARQLTPGATPESTPSWSPDGTRLVFGRYRDWPTSSVHNLWLIDADGSGARQLTTAGTYDGKAAWSPDGSQIVFQRHFLAPYTGTALYVTYADGSFVHAVEGPGDNYQPDWAPGAVPPPTIDITPPTITISRPQEGDVYTLGEVVPAAYSCTDESGIIHCFGTASLGAPIATGSVGAHTFGVDAVDRAENPAFRSVSYRVVFPFNGFAAPIVDGGWTTVKAGDGVPLKFSLGGSYGLDVLAGARAQTLDCVSGSATGPSSSVPGSFAYNASLDRYMFVWATEKAWGGTCRTIFLMLSDGTIHRADLRLTK
jgi:WD40-like Beta Propeller Repeat